MQAEEAAPTIKSGDSDGRQPTSYEVLQVHPAAPLELITAAYWRLAGDVQARRSVDSSAEADLHALTRAYQTLTSPELRAEYDHSIGIAEQNLAPVVPHRRKTGFLGRSRDIAADRRVDYYEILRIIPDAEPAIVDEAYSVLKTYYVRLVQSNYSPIELLDYLEDAYVVVSDPDQRRKYDAERKPAPAPAAPVAAVAAAPAPRPKAAEKPRAKPAPAPAPPRAPAVTVAPSKKPAAAQGASPMGAVTGAFGALGRQFSSMSKREQEQLEERKTEREHEKVDTSEIEAALLQRISSSIDAPNGADEQEVARSIARLTVTEGPDQGTIFEIQHFPLTIGGAEACDLTLPALAPEHARLLFRDGRFVVYNLAPPESGADGEFEPLSIVESGEELAVGPYQLRFTAIRD
jgi:curved DNA-binding protein CbpA